MTCLVVCGVVCGVVCVVLYLRESELLGDVEIDLAFQVQRERKAFI